MNTESKEIKEVLRKLKIGAEPSMPVTGKLYSRILWRGVSPTGPTDEGMFGKGTYYTTYKDTAIPYSTGAKGEKGEVLEHKVTLINPYVAHGGEVQALGSDAFSKARREGKDYSAANEMKSRAIRGILEKQGYDGIVMASKNPYTGLIHSEVVVFRPEKSAKLSVVLEITLDKAKLKDAYDWVRARNAKGVGITGSWAGYRRAIYDREVLGLTPEEAAVIPINKHELPPRDWSIPPEYMVAYFRGGRTKAEAIKKVQDVYIPSLQAEAIKKSTARPVSEFERKLTGELTKRMYPKRKVVRPKRAKKTTVGLGTRR